MLRLKLGGGISFYALESPEWSNPTMKTTQTMMFVDSRFLPGKKLFATGKELLSRERGALDSSPG